MSRCEEYQELISRMVDGELTARQKAALEEHIRNCAECAALYSAFSALSQQIGEDLEEVPLDLRENVMAEIRRDEIRRKNRIPTALRGVFAVAACLALILGVSLGVSPQLRGRVSAAAYPKMAEEPMQRAMTTEAAVEESAVDAGKADDFADEATESFSMEAPAAEADASFQEKAAGTDSVREAETASEEPAAEILDFSEWMDLKMLRQLLGAVPTELTLEDLEQEADWSIRVKTEEDSCVVRIYLRDGKLYYVDPETDAVFQAELSREDFQEFLES